MQASILSEESEEFCTDFLNKQKVAVVPGNAFGETGEGFVRISYAYSMEHLRKAMDKLDKYITRLITAFGKSRGIGERRQVIIRSVGMNGCVRLNTLEHTASTIIKVNDVYASAYHFMDMLAGRLELIPMLMLFSPYAWSRKYS